MLRFSNAPLQPGGFADQVSDAITGIEAIIKIPSLPKSSDFADKWRNFKSDLLVAQHNKCGYCEQFLGTHPGDVEHFRPKAELQQLPADKNKWGSEGDGDFSVVGRSPAHVSDAGYWWEAYKWENYLAACNRCNSGWKRNLFPTDEVPRQAPVRNNPENPLLLNPFSGDDPADHLEYDKIGQIKPHKSSKLGEATIATCGLDRASLVQARAEKVTRAFRLVDEYHRAQTNEERHRILADFIEMGSEKFIFAGMVRAIFRQQLQLPWDLTAKAVQQGD